MSSPPPNWTVAARGGDPELTHFGGLLTDEYSGLSTNIHSTKKAPAVSMAGQLS